MAASIESDAPDTPEDPLEDDVLVLPWWQNPRNIITMLVAVALVAGMAGWILGDSRGDVPSSDADVGFLHDMRAHHEQAVEMSLIFLGLDDTAPELTPVARSIAFGQAIEIGLMIQLLRDMGAPEVGDPGQAMAWMGMPMDEADMAGMASREELNRLVNAAGTDADELYIELMIAHHRGGIDMAAAAVDQARNPEVRRYAAAWAATQEHEIDDLEMIGERLG